MTATIAVVPDRRLNVETGHHPEGRYVEWFWLPIVGPSGCWIYRRLGSFLHVDGCRDGYELEVDYLAASLGMQPPLLTRGIDRCHRFHLVHIELGSGVLAVPAWAPTISPRQLEKLPASVQAQHEMIRAESLASQRDSG